LKADSFSDLQKQVPQETDFLRRDLRTRTVKAAEIAANERTVRRRLVGTASTFLEAFGGAQKHAHSLTNAQAISIG